MKNKQAFTLVELIVVVTILAILSAIGFVSYSSYLTGVRDTNRVAQLDSMHGAMVMYGARKKLPIPDDVVEIKNDGKIIARQGNLGADVLETLEYSKEGLDPMDGVPFSYMLTTNKKHFQLMALLEEEDSYNIATLSENESGRYPYVLGNKLGILTNTQATPVQNLESNISVLELDTTDEKYVGVIDNKQVIEGDKTVLVEIEKLTSTGGKGCKSDGGSIDCTSSTSSSTAGGLTGWRLVDPNCTIDDITVGAQTWAGCNSTLGVGVEFPVGTMSFDRDTNSWETAGSDIAGSITKDTDFYSVANGAFDTIWGKFYTHANKATACSTGWRVPTVDDINNLLTVLNSGVACPDVSGKICPGLNIGTEGFEAQSETNNILQALKFPLSGAQAYNSSDFGGRGKDGYMWSSSEIMAGGLKPAVLLLQNGSDALGYRGEYNLGFSYSVRCIKE